MELTLLCSAGAEDTIPDIVVAAGASIVKAYPQQRIFQIEVDAAQKAVLEANPAVECIEDCAACPGPVGTAHTAEYGLQWGAEYVGAHIAHSNGLMGQGVRLVVVDSGYTFGHPDLPATIAGGWNVINDTTDVADDNGHGTGVTGIMVAKINGTGLVGICPDAELYIIKYLNQNRLGSWPNIYKVNQILIDLTEGGTIPVVANHSYGAENQPGSPIKASYQAAADAGVLHFCIAGNSGPLENSINWPGRWTELCINTGYIRPEGDLGGSSSKGPELNFVAPGSDINSTHWQGAFAQTHGSSNACPHLAGMAVLALQGGIAPAAMFDTMKASTGVTVHTEDFGWGTPNIATMLGLSEVPLPPPPEPTEGLIMRYVKLVSLGCHGGGPVANAKEINLLGPDGSPLDRSGWTASADSEQAGREAIKAIDADSTQYSYWSTDWSANPPHPHEFIIDTGVSQSVTGLTYRPVNASGISDYEVYGSEDGTNWGVPLVTGTFTTVVEDQTALFPTLASLNTRVTGLEGRVTTLEGFHP